MSDSAMVELGRIYQSGLGVAVDVEHAFKWYQKASDLGNTFGMNDLGWCYEKGIGCVQDLKVAASLYLRAAEGGNIYGENNIGEPNCLALSC
jgi:TPR repeat protein